MSTDVIPDSHDDLLEAPGFAHIASLGPEGEPQSHPVWYDWRDGELLVSTTKSRQKYRNYQRDPWVAITILDPEQPYRYLEIRGRVTEIEDDPEQAFIDVLAKKYLGTDSYPWRKPGEERVIVHIRPDKANTMG
jgi:PPOX class probable F420-dependent enzyme